MQSQCNKGFMGACFRTTSSRDWGKTMPYRLIAVIATCLLFMRFTGLGASAAVELNMVEMQGLLGGCYWTKSYDCTPNMDCVLRSTPGANHPCDINQDCFPYKQVLDVVTVCSPSGTGSPCEPKVDWCGERHDCRCYALTRRCQTSNLRQMPYNKPKP